MGFGTLDQETTHTFEYERVDPRQESGGIGYLHAPSNVNGRQMDRDGLFSSGVYDRCTSRDGIDLHATSGPYLIPPVTIPGYSPVN